jgi:hypothetical protein
MSSVPSSWLGKPPLPLRWAVGPYRVDMTVTILQANEVNLMPAEWSPCEPSQAEKMALLEEYVNGRDAELQRAADHFDVGIVVADAWAPPGPNGLPMVYATVFSPGQQPERNQIPAMPPNA